MLCPPGSPSWIGKGDLENPWPEPCGKHCFDLLNPKDKDSTSRRQHSSMSLIHTSPHVVTGIEEFRAALLTLIKCRHDSTSRASPASILSLFVLLLLLLKRSRFALWTSPHPCRTNCKSLRCSFPAAPLKLWVLPPPCSYSWSSSLPPTVLLRSPLGSTGHGPVHHLVTVPTHRGNAQEWLNEKCGKKQWNNGYTSFCVSCDPSYPLLEQIQEQNLYIVSTGLQQRFNRGGHLTWWLGHPLDACIPRQSACSRPSSSHIWSNLPLLCALWSLLCALWSLLCALWSRCWLKCLGPRHHQGDLDQAGIWEASQHMEDLSLPLSFK